MDMDEEPFPQQLDAFPQQMSDAAKVFPNFSAAYAQLRSGGDYINLHLQAPEIMMRFAGRVQFGMDPKGILFYESCLDVGVAAFTVFYYEGLETWKTVRVDFYSLQGHSHLKLFARFLARVDTKKYKLPPVRPGLGQGEWMRFKAATSKVDVLRQEDSTRLYLQFPPLQREVYFDTSGRSCINASGILIFRDLKKLKDNPLEDDSMCPDHRPLVADYAPDRIVFRLHSKDGRTNLKEFGLFLPDHPLKDIGKPDPDCLPETKWRDFDDEADMKAGG